MYTCAAGANECEVFIQTHQSFRWCIASRPNADITCSFYAQCMEARARGALNDNNVTYTIAYSVARSREVPCRYAVYTRAYRSQTSRRYKPLVVVVLVTAAHASDPTPTCYQTTDAPILLMQICSCRTAEP